MVPRFPDAVGLTEVVCSQGASFLGETQTDEECAKRETSDFLAYRNHAGV